MWETWRREDVAPGDRFERGGELYEVISVGDLPTVTVRPIDYIECRECEHDHRETWVIQSPIFAEFTKLVRTRPA